MPDLAFPWGPRVLGVSISKTSGLFGRILDGFRKLEFSSEENVSLIKTKAKEVDQKLETLKKLIQTQSDQASLEDYS